MRHRLFDDVQIDKRAVLTLDLRQWLFTALRYSRMPMPVKGVLCLCRGALV